MKCYELFVQTPIEVFAQFTHLLTEEQIPWDCDMQFTEIGQWTVVKIHCRSSKERDYAENELFNKACDLSL